MHLNYEFKKYTRYIYISGFGTTSPTQSNSTFEALATQDAGVTFGNLAQGGPTSTQQPTSLFGGSSTSNSFSSTGPSFG